MSFPNFSEFVIIGAGIHGLSTAWRLAKKLNEIGEEFNLTRERVRQIKEKAIRRLRHRSRSKSLRTYLG